MHFTRDPIIESVITPREGCKLVVRSSKGVGQEEYFVDAVEVVNFGTNCFFRSQERPKAFLVPASDYEVLEVRETRVVLRHAAAAEKSIKISTREKEKPADAAPPKRERAPRKEKEEVSPERKKERRKRRRRGKEERESPETAAPGEEDVGDSAPAERAEEKAPIPIPRVIPPPKSLISESINRYKEMLSLSNDEKVGRTAARVESEEESNVSPRESDSE